jgi:mono/diheme cytochrome c family protein
MRAHENYTPHIAVAFGLTLAILAAFQLYLLREPGRIASVLAADKSQAVQAGQLLFDKNCAPCHGSQGEGDVGPALNDKQFLNATNDGTIFSLISSGVPGTRMPAWNQSHGGPFTDEDVGQLVTFIRSWEPAAPDRQATPVAGDPARGAQIFSSVCFICHGVNGAGTDRAPVLNDPALLNKFDDTWFRNTIMAGRPAQGMPTWGTVLSPQQIADVLALIDQWRATPGASAPTPAPTNGPSEIARPTNPGGPGPALNLAGDSTAGAPVFVANCQKCHGDAGKGGVANPGSTDGSVPALNPIDATLLNQDSKVFAYNLDLFIEHGSTPSGDKPQLTMPAWGDQKKLTDQQIADVIAYVISVNRP